MTSSDVTLTAGIFENFREGDFISAVNKRRFLGQRKKNKEPFISKFSLYSKLAPLIVMKH